MTTTSVLLRCIFGLAALCLTACSTTNDVGLSMFASKANSYLLVNGQRLEGSVYLIPGRTGRVAFSGGEGAITACNGTLRYSGTNTAEIDLRCSDRSAAVLKVTLITETRGFGYGRTATAPVSLAFGLSEEAAMAYLGSDPVKPATPEASPAAQENAAPAASASPPPEAAEK